MKPLWYLMHWNITKKNKKIIDENLNYNYKKIEQRINNSYIYLNNDFEKCLNLDFLKNMVDFGNEFAKAGKKNARIIFNDNYFIEIDRSTIYFVNIKDKEKESFYDDNYYNFNISYKVDYNKTLEYLKSWINNNV